MARETTTGRDGTFYLRNLLPGTYTVKAEPAGFKALERTELKLDANQIMNLGSLSLQVGQTTESITVEAEVPLVETSTSQKSFVITSRQVTQLRLNGRDFQSLMRTLPGVVSNEHSATSASRSTTPTQFNVNGLRGSMNNVYLDGSINTDVGANDGQYTQVSLDAVGEFKVQTSTFNAEYGRNPGVMISINTKSGSTQFHGTLYEFLRNNAFDARQPFDTTGTHSENSLQSVRRQPRRTRSSFPSFSSGDNKKLFFFFNLRRTLVRSRPLGSNFVDIPHADLLNGDLSRLYRPGFIADADGQPTQFRNGQVFRPGTVVRDQRGPHHRRRSVSEQHHSADRMEPQRSGVPQDPERRRSLGSRARTRRIRSRFGIRSSNVYSSTRMRKVARIDYNISPNANFFFRWADDAQREDQTISASSQHSVSRVFRSIAKKPGVSWSWNLVNVLSPTMTNEAIFTYNHLTQVVDVWPRRMPTKLCTTAPRSASRFTDLYPDVEPAQPLSALQLRRRKLQFQQAFPLRWLSEGKTFAFTDNFTFNQRPHTFKFGVFWNRNDNGQQPNGPIRPTSTSVPAPTTRATRATVREHAARQLHQHQSE